MDIDGLITEIHTESLGGGTLEEQDRGHVNYPQHPRTQRLRTGTTQLTSTDKPLPPIQYDLELIRGPDGSLTWVE